MHKGPRRFTKKKESKITSKHHRSHKEESDVGKVAGPMPTYKADEFFSRQK